MKPYSKMDLAHIALSGVEVDPSRVIATYADPRNWRQVEGEDHLGPRNYWAWVGPTIVGYSLAAWAPGIALDPDVMEGGEG